MESKFWDVFLVLTSAIFGGLLTALGYLYLNFHLESDVVDAFIQSIGTIIAGFGAILAGAFVWWSKRAEINEEKRKEQEFRDSFKVQLATDLTHLFIRAKVLKGYLDAEQEKVSALKSAGILDPLKVFIDGDNPYTKNLDHNIIRKLALIDVGTRSVNSALELMIKHINEGRDHIFKKSSHKNVVPMLIEIENSSIELVKILDPQMFFEQELDLI